LHIFKKEQIMPNTSKSSKKKTATAAKREFVDNSEATTNQFADTVTPLYVNGVTRVAEFQKTALDLVADGTSEWIGAWKKAFSVLPVAAPTFFFDIANQAVQTAVETQKGVIDLLVEQSEAVTEIAKQRADAYSKIAETATTAFQTTVSRSVEAQKRALAFATENNKTIFAATKKQVGNGPASVLVDTIERGTDTLLKAQRSILDATTQPFVA
jgi:dsDNA-binding SOS-regulon protein